MPHVVLGLVIFLQVANIVYLLDEIAQTVPLLVLAWIERRRLYIIYRRILFAFFVGVIFLLLLFFLGSRAFVFRYLLDHGFGAIAVLWLLLFFSAIPVSAPWFEPVVPARLAIGLQQQARLEQPTVRVELAAHSASVLEADVLDPEAKLHESESRTELVICHVGDLEGQREREAKVDVVLAVPHHLVVNKLIVEGPLLCFELEHGQKVDHRVELLRLVDPERLGLDGRGDISGRSCHVNLTGQASVIKLNL